MFWCHSFRNNNQLKESCFCYCDCHSPFCKKCSDFFNIWWIVYAKLQKESSFSPLLIYSPLLCMLCQWQQIMKQMQLFVLQRICNQILQFLGYLHQYEKHSDKGNKQWWWLMMTMERQKPDKQWCWRQQTELFSKHIRSNEELILQRITGSNTRSILTNSYSIAYWSCYEFLLPQNFSWLATVHGYCPWAAPVHCQGSRWG